MYQSEKLINNLYDAIVFWLTEWSVKNPKNNKEIYFWKEGQDNTCTEQVSMSCLNSKQ